MGVSCSGQLRNWYCASPFRVRRLVWHWKVLGRRFDEGCQQELRLATGYHHPRLGPAKAHLPPDRVLRTLWPYRVCVGKIEEVGPQLIPKPRTSEMNVK